jgi:hypothetical protein
VTVLVDEAELVGLTKEYLDQLARLSDALAAEIKAIFLDLEHLNRADVERFAREATPYFRAGRSEAIDLTSGYLSEMTGARLDTIDLRDGAIGAEFEAPFLRTWHNLKSGQPWEQARQGGASQAEAVGNDYARRGAADRMAKPGTKVRGYRRVITPSACEWCRVVSTQIYRSPRTAGFGHGGAGNHHKCHCTVVAVPVGADPGAAINKARLAELKASGAVSRVSSARAKARA